MPLHELTTTNVDWFYEGVQQSLLLFLEDYQLRQCSAVLLNEHTYTSLGGICGWFENDFTSPIINHCVSRIFGDTHHDAVLTIVDYGGAIYPPTPEQLREHGISINEPISYVESINPGNRTLYLSTTELASKISNVEELKTLELNNNEVFKLTWAQ